MTTGSGYVWTVLSAGGVLAVRAALLRSRPHGPGAFLLAGRDGRRRAVPVPVAVAVPVRLDRDALGDDPAGARPRPAQEAPGSRRRHRIAVRRRACELRLADPAPLQL